MSDPHALRVLVLGASGRVGREILRQGRARGLRLTAQTRDARTLADIDGDLPVAAFDPADPAALRAALADQDAVIFAIGTRSLGPTTLFSGATRALVAAMEERGPKRLVAITGVGAGETRGHGGFLYDWIVYPLFTRHLYADKTRQEEIIARSGLDWTIVRPAAFSDQPGVDPLVYTRIEPGLALRRISIPEVATFVLDEVTSDLYLRRKPFIGHP